MAALGLGAPDDCDLFPLVCPGGIRNQVFSVTVTPFVGPDSSFYFVALDGTGNFAVLGNVYAETTVIAGAGLGSPAPVPSPSAGSLVSYTNVGTGSGDVLLGAATGYVKCDYGETNTGVLTCNKPLVVSGGGVQPNGISGAYAPEAFPIGAKDEHPRVLSGSCPVTAPSTGCVFPNTFAFSDDTYNCTVSPKGTTPLSESYVKSSTSEITIYAPGSATVSYICIGD